MFHWTDIQKLTYQKIVLVKLIINDHVDLSKLNTYVAKSNIILGLAFFYALIPVMKVLSSRFCSCIWGSEK